jgi:hypothetical protein
MNRDCINWVIDLKTVEQLVYNNISEACHDSNDKCCPWLNIIARAKIIIKLFYPVTATSPAKLPLHNMTRLYLFLLVGLRK